STRPKSGFVPNGSLDRRPAGADQTAAPGASSPSRRPSSASEPLELHVLDARLAEGSRLRGYVPEEKREELFFLIAKVDTLFVPEELPGSPWPPQAEPKHLRPRQHAADALPARVQRDGRARAGSGR